jgi:putative transcriptional regulator
MFAASFGEGRKRRRLRAGPAAQAKLARAVYAIDAHTPLTYKSFNKSSYAAASAKRLDYSRSATGAMKSEILRFDELLANVRQASARAGSARRAIRCNEINALTVKRLRGWTSLSQPEFARLLGVELGTLRNWEQGRREPTGPARALLRAISNDPEHVLRALRSAGRRRTALRRRADAA